MASKTEGIALLSMYNDDEEEEEEEEAEAGRASGGSGDDSKEEGFATPPEPPPESTSPAARARSPLGAEDSLDLKTLRSPVPPTPPSPGLPPSRQSSPLPLASPSPPPPLRPSQPQPATVSESADAQRVRRGSLAIVDYAHDEMAMSPETEEGEILSGGRVAVSVELQISDGYFEERLPPGRVHVLTPSTQQEPPQPSDLPEQSKSENSTAMDFTAAEPEVAQGEVAAGDSEDAQKDDLLSRFLKPPPTTKCPEELQVRIKKFLAYRMHGKSFNADLRNRKDYRNPDFLQHAVRFQDIDQIGSCFSKDVFDPHGYDKSDYYDEIEADMKREMERKEQERKKSQKVEFVAGGVQPGPVPSAAKIATLIPGASAAVASGLQSVSTAMDAISKDIRQNKKTKWDKIDGDVKIPTHSGGHDNLPTVGVHTVHFSAANAGTGYTAFAQQKRREAEEKRSSERKLDKRS